MVKLKGYCAIVLLAAALPSVAQQPDAMSGENMQDMMQGMMQMASCMQNIDQDKLKVLADESEALEAELKQLCAAGERDQAQQKAIAFGQAFIQSEEFQQLQQCGEAAQDMMPDLADYASYEDDADGVSSTHVCDEI